MRRWRALTQTPPSQSSVMRLFAFLISTTALNGIIDPRIQSKPSRPPLDALQLLNMIGWIGNQPLPTKVTRERELSGFLQRNYSVEEEKDSATGVVVLATGQLHVHMLHLAIPQVRQKLRLNWYHPCWRKTLRLSSQRSRKKSSSCPKSPTGAQGKPGSTHRGVQSV